MADSASVTLRLLKRLVPWLIAAVGAYDLGRPALWRRAAVALVVVPIVRLWVWLDIRHAERARRRRGLIG